MYERPYVCISDFTVKLFPKKYANRLKSKSPAVRNEAIRKYAESFELKNYPITLSDDGTFPTKKTKRRVLKSAFMYARKKDDFDKYIVRIENIKVKTKSKVNYEFNYEKD
jgi:hypothetical protein